MCNKDEETKGNSFVADEDLRSRNVLLLTSFLLREYVNCSDTPEKGK